MVDAMRPISVPIPNVQLRVVVLPDFAPGCNFPVEGFEVLHTPKRVGILEMLRNLESGDGATKMPSLGRVKDFLFSANCSKETLNEVNLGEAGSRGWRLVRQMVTR
jgi:hypothetical protein